jgi:hypothetical protein
MKLRQLKGKMMANQALEADRKKPLPLSSTLAKKDMKKYSRNIPLYLIFFFLGVPILAGCTRQKDRFWPDTQDGILQFQ